MSSSSPATADPADLTEHRVVHRAVSTDLARLASVVPAIDRGGNRDQPRSRAFDDYLAALAIIVERHLRIDDECLPELFAGVRIRPPIPPRADARQLLRLLERAGSPDARGGALGDALMTSARLAGRLFDDQESTLFPSIQRHARVCDVRRVQERYRAELPAGMLAFVIPWTVRHATPHELDRLTDPALCVTYKIFARRFEALEYRVFGDGPGVRGRTG